MGAPSTTNPVEVFSVGSVLVDDSIAYEAASKFIKGTVTLSPTSGGENNVMLYVTLPDGHLKYILRVYNNGNDSARVKWEHDILRQLNQQNLSFKVPKAVPTLKDGKSHTVLSNGAEAAMFEIIPGKLPKLTCVRDIGRASGELSAAMEKVKLNLPCPTTPFYDLYTAHHAVDRESFFRVLRSKEFDSVRAAAQKAEKYVLEMEGIIEKHKAQKLPKVVIHGDLHYDNILVDQDTVTGCLDFEFSAYDWRAMELAVCLAKYAGEKEAMTYFNDFIDGFVVHGRLTPIEIEAIPDLVNLRTLSNVIYYVGRAIAMEDSIASITTRIETYITRIAWIKPNAQAIRENITSKMKKYVPDL